MINNNSTDFNNTMTNPQPSEPVMMVLLQGGHVAPKPFYDTIRDLILDQTPAIKPNHVVILENFYDPEDWRKMDVEERKLGGRCMAHMVIHGILPLDFVGCKHSSPNEYQLKQSGKVDNNCIPH